MNPSDTIEVIDKNQWRLEIPVPGKRFIYIGSGPSNDIVLDPSRGGGVALRHLQLISLTDGESGYRIVNLSNQDLLLGEEGQQRLAPTSSAISTSNQTIRVGEFTLVLKFEASTEFLEQRSEIVGLSLDMPGSRLHPKRPLEGTVTLRNLSDKSGVQFKIELEGMDTESFDLDCPELEPGPILYPGAEKAFPLRLYHSKGPWPPAGPHRIAIRATAAEADGGESATVSKTIEIAPYYRHSMNLVAKE